MTDFVFVTAGSTDTVHVTTTPTDSEPQRAACGRNISHIIRNTTPLSEWGTYSAPTGTYLWHNRLEWDRKRNQHVMNEITMHVCQNCMLVKSVQREILVVQTENRRLARIAYKREQDAANLEAAIEYVSEYGLTTEILAAALKR